MFMSISSCLSFFLSCWASFLRVVAGRDEEVGEHRQLVLGELELVILPIVLVGALELLQSLLHTRLKKKETKT